MGGWNEAGDYVYDTRSWWEQVGLPAAAPQYHTNEPTKSTTCWKRADSRWLYICGGPVVDVDLGLCQRCIDALKEGQEDERLPDAG